MITAEPPALPSNSSSFQPRPLGLFNSCRCLWRPFHVMTACTSVYRQRRQQEECRLLADALCASAHGLVSGRIHPVISMGRLHSLVDHVSHRCLGRPQHTPPMYICTRARQAALRTGAAGGRSRMKKRYCTLRPSTQAWMRSATGPMASALAAGRGGGDAQRDPTWSAGLISN